MADVTIVGGGIIGLCSALALQDRGFDVEIIERRSIGCGASYGNCGLLAPGEIVPVSRPGVLRKVPGWLLDPQGPLFVRPRGIARDLEWLLRFVRSGRPKRVREIAAALTPLMRRVEADYRTVLQRTDQSERLSEVETVMLFSSRDQYDRDRYAWDLRSEFGFNHYVVTRDDVRRMEPAINGEVAFGVVMKDWFHFTNPLGMQERFATYFQSRQGRILTGEVTGFDAKLGSVQALVLADGRRHPVRNVVLAAGAWSGTLASHLGVKIPIAHLQGYHIQVHDPKVKIERSIYYAPGSFVLTPMETGLRIGGTIEIAGPDPKPDYRRADVLAQRARTILPELDLSKVDRWMGPRPFMPDTLPVIGRAPHHGNVVLAFGHGQIGMTLGATTGQLVAELVTHEKPSVDLAPFRPERFSSRS